MISKQTGGAGVSSAEQLRQVLSTTLQLGPRAASLQLSSQLLGALPELDSVKVIDLIGAIEERFDIEIADDEIEAATFATLGALADFVDGKLAMK